MDYSIKNFGKLKNGAVVDLIKVTSKNFTVELLNYGGIIKSIKVPDVSGFVSDVVLGYDNLEGYEKDIDYVGCVIGRVANRIENAKFTIDEKVYHLEANDGKNHLHGGSDGFHKKLWDYDIDCKKQVCKINMWRTSPHNEAGYPGNLKVTLTYTITADAQLKFEINANSDRKTPVNLTIHPYFNLSSSAQNILNHQLQINAKEYTPLNEQNISTGAITSTANTAFDLREPLVIGEHFEQFKIELAKGFDQNFVIYKKETEIVKVAELIDEESGRKLEILSNQPGLQVYSAYYLNIKNAKDGKAYEKFAGIAIEPQQFPNAINQPNFDATIVDKNSTYYYVSIFKFGLTI